jgi:Streptomycin adenylyltransferase
MAPRIKLTDEVKLKMASDTINEFLRDVTEWASDQRDIQALALLGSYARNAAKETSDVDLVLIAVDPDVYLKDTTWVQQFGIVKEQQIEDYGLLISVRVYYTDGREVEYGITDQRWSAVPLDEGTRQVIADGMRVLFERGKILSRHQSAEP